MSGVSGELGFSGAAWGSIGGKGAYLLEAAAAMDMNLLMASFVFGTVGMGFFMYGKKAGRYVAMGTGAALMVVPYFITSLTVMMVVCAGLMAVPWVVKEG